MVLTRRQLIQVTAGISAAATIYIASDKAERPTWSPKQIFVDLDSQYTTASEVAKSFVRAKTPFLMASYVLCLDPHAAVRIMRL